MSANDPFGGAPATAGACVLLDFNILLFGGLVPDDVPGCTFRVEERRGGEETGLAGAFDLEFVKVCARCNFEASPVEISSAFLLTPNVRFDRLDDELATELVPCGRDRCLLVEAGFSAFCSLGADVPRSDPRYYAESVSHS